MLLFPLWGAAQSYYFQHYSVGEGLPFIHTYAINQDTNGYLWIGGYGGLSRFDGLDFKNFTREDGLLSNRIKSMVRSPDGTLWVLTTKGLNVLRNDTIHAHPMNAEIAHLDIRALHSVTKSTLLLGTSNGLFELNANGLKQVGSIDISVFCFEWHNGRILVGTKEGLFHYQPTKNSLKPVGEVAEEVVRCLESIGESLWVGTERGLIHLTPRLTQRYTVFDGLPANRINALQQFGTAGLWVATNNGLAEISAGEVELLFVDSRANSNQIETLFQDREGNLWLGTYNGIYKFNSAGFRHFGFKDGLSATFIYGLARDNRENLWIGTRSSGVYRYNGTSFTAFTSAHGLAGNRIGPIETKGNRVYIGTNKGLSIYQVNQRKFLSSPLVAATKGEPINDILFYQDTIWLAGHHKLIRYTDNMLEEQVLPLAETHQIWALHRDVFHRIWVGTYEGGLWMVKGDSVYNFGEQIDVNIESVLDIIATDSHSVWLATFQGVIHYDFKRKATTKVSTAEGLSSPLVYSLLQQDSVLWIGTNQGINRLALNSFSSDSDPELISYNLKDGFVGVECNTHGVWADADGKLWFGTVNGLISFEDAAYRREEVLNTNFITGVQIAYRDTNLAANDTLPYGTNQISFSFKGICLSNPDKVEYRYRLKGFNDEWSPPTVSRIASYSNLSSGNYEFQVISSNENGTWNRDPTTFAFSIATPFFRQPWFVVASVAGGLLVLSGIYLGIATSLKRKSAVERRLDNLKLQALRAQMNPHFIFNALNSIQHFINSNEKRQANNYLSLFARLMRLVLQNSKSPYVSIEDDLEALKLYIEIEQTRFEQAFNYTIQVDDAIDLHAMGIPPLLIQPFVENCINHGFAQMKRKGQIEIALKLNGDELVCTIQDNGIGREAATRLNRKMKKAHASAATTITQDRLTTMKHKYRDELSLEIEDLYESNEPTGTKVTLHIPYKTISHESLNR